MTARALGFWSDYWKSLKPLAVEEPIDVWVHRPLAYVLAKALYPTAVSPNLVTFLSIVFGAIAGYSFVAPFEHHMQLGALSLFVSAIFDCADGQLARMRKSSSAFGRMLDGVADLVVIGAAAGGAGYHIFMGHRDPPWLGAVVLVLIVSTMVTGSFHTSSYDHYKNVYLKMTTPSFHEGEDYESALQRYRARPKAEFGVLARLAWPIYLFYVRSQERYIHRFDPYTQSSINKLPPFNAERAAIYEAHAGPLMALWRGAFGFGSLVFGIALFAALDALALYMALRLVAQNALYYGYLRPRQRQASKRAFESMGHAVS